MVSHKRYVSNLVLANIIITLVAILFSLNVIKNIKRDDMLFINTSIVIINFVSLMCAYFGIIGVIHKYSCQLNAYSILSRLLIISEISLYLYITFSSARHDWNSYYYRVSASALSIAALVLVLSQIWLLFETQVYQNSMQYLANNGENDFDSDSVRRRVSTPPNICDFEKNERLFTLSDQVLINPLIDENYNNERLESLNEMNNNFAFDVSHSTSMSQPLYQQLTQTLPAYKVPEIS